MVVETTTLGDSSHTKRLLIKVTPPTDVIVPLPSPDPIQFAHNVKTFLKRVLFLCLIKVASYLAVVNDDEKILQKTRTTRVTWNSE